MDKQAENDLALSLLAGEPAAFERFVEHFRSKVFHYAWLMCGQPEDAEEVAQETLLKVFESIGQLRQPELVRPWVFRIAHNRRIDVGRRSREHAYEAADLFAIPDPAAGSDVNIDAAQREEHVHAALDALPQEQFKMVQLAFFEGLSHATIAAQTNLPIGTVKSRLRLAFSRLRRLLHDAGVIEA